jgi:hypothetical protein
MILAEVGIFVLGDQIHDRVIDTVVLESRRPPTVATPVVMLDLDEVDDIKHDGHSGLNAVRVDGPHEPNGPSSL